MAFILNKFYLQKKQRIFRFLMDELDITMAEAQKYIDKGRVFYDGNALKNKGAMIDGEIEVIVFKPEPQGLNPVFENEDFAVFEKPSGMLVHPRKRDDKHTLNDEIKSLFGPKANAVHRIDKETSGLVLVAKNKVCERELKTLFETKKIAKEYIALVRGKIEKNLFINEKLLINHPFSSIKIKVHVDDNGKESITKIEPLNYDKIKNISLIRAIPLTGRQHQIRAHLFHVKHPILGDTLYGQNEEDTNRFLLGEMVPFERFGLSGASRLLLHASRLSFNYKGRGYDIKSKTDIQKEFYGAINE